MKKRIWAGIFSAALLVSAVVWAATPAKTVEFTDVPKEHWASAYIYELAKDGIVGGYGDGTFCPDKTVERAEFAKMLVGVTKTPLSTSRVSPYQDVPRDQWYFPYINTVGEYMTGYTEGGTLYFRPEWEATREDVAVALVKARGVDLSPYTDPTGFLSARFLDVDSISEHNRVYIAAAVDKGYLSGDSEGTFRGQDFIIRAEVTAVLCRAF